MKLNKPVKVTINGRRQSNIDLHRTFMGRVGYNIKRGTYWLLKWTIITGTIGTACVLLWSKGDTFSWSRGVKELTNIPQALTKPTLEAKIDELKDKIVEDIRNCERSKYSENDGIIIFDSNEEASIGTFQFQRKTVIHYYKTLYQKTITPKEAILISLDEPKARSLVKDIIFKDSKGWRNWYNCGIKKEISAEQRVKIIKELEQ